MNHVTYSVYDMDITRFSYQVTHYQKKKYVNVGNEPNSVALIYNGKHCVNLQCVVVLSSGEYLYVIPQLDKISPSIRSIMECTHSANTICINKLRPVVVQSASSWNFVYGFMVPIQGPFYYHKLTQTATWTNDCAWFIWDVITHPCPKLNDSLMKPPLKIRYWWVDPFLCFTWIWLFIRAATPMLV